jgi:hypothetical protein
MSIPVFIHIYSKRDCFSHQNLLFEYTGCIFSLVSEEYLNNFIGSLVLKEKKSYYSGKLLTHKISTATTLLDEECLSTLLGCFNERLSTLLSIIDYVSLEYSFNLHINICLELESGTKKLMISFYFKKKGVKNRFTTDYYTVEDLFNSIKRNSFSGVNDRLLEIVQFDVGRLKRVKAIIDPINSIE